MKKILAVVVAALAVAGGWVQSAVAQQAQDKGVPVEFFGCNYQNGKGLQDLQKVGEKFSKWSAKNDSGYSAWILTPQFHTNLDMDVGWLGSWPNANAMGKGQDTWLAGGRELASDFEKVIDCSRWHESATAAAINAPKEPPGNGVVLFSECTMVAGKSPADALPAHRKVGAEMAALGSKASSWLFYPGMGNSDIDFHYWSVIGFNNYTELGAASELYINGGGWQKAMGILGPVTRCKPPTVFDAHLVRAGAAS